MAQAHPTHTRMGPFLVILGASMWGLEAFWRLRLSQHFDADVLVFHEHWLGLILTLPFLVVGWRALAGVSRRAWISMVVSGVFGSALGTVCYTQAITMMNVSVANLLLNLQPFLCVFASWLWLGEKPGRQFYPWAVVAVLCGMVLAWSPDALKDPHVFALGLVFVGGTIFSWGISTTAGRGAMLEIDFKTAVTLRYAIGAVSTLAVVVARGVSVHRLNAGALFTGPVFLDMLSLLLIAGATPTFIYFAGLARTPASVATFAEMAQTLASLLVSWGQLGDALTGPQCLAGAVLLMAVVNIDRSVGVAGEAAPPPEPAVVLDVS